MGDRGDQCGLCPSRPADTKHERPTARRVRAPGDAGKRNRLGRIRARDEAARDLGGHSSDTNVTRSIPERF